MKADRMWIKFNPNDFDDVARGIDSVIEHGFFHVLLVAAMRTGRARPLDLTRDEMLKLCKATPSQLPHLIRVLEKCFYLGPRGYELIRDAQILQQAETPKTDKTNETNIERIKKTLDGNKSVAEGLESVPKQIREREYKRKYRDQLETLRETALAVGLKVPEGAKIRQISAALVDRMKDLESKTLSVIPGEVVNRQELELLDNARGMRGAEAKGQVLSVVEPEVECKGQDLSFYPLERTENVRLDSRGEGGGLGAGGLSSVKDVGYSCISNPTHNIVSITNNLAPGATAQPATPAGAACRALRRAGVPDVNPSHPKLLSLLAQGVTASELADAAAECVPRGNGRFAYVLAMVENRRRREAEAKPLPGPVYMPSGETVDELDRRIFGKD